MKDKYTTGQDVGALIQDLKYVVGKEGLNINVAHMYFHYTDRFEAMVDMQKAIRTGTYNKAVRDMKDYGIHNTNQSIEDMLEVYRK